MNVIFAAAPFIYLAAEKDDEYVRQLTTAILEVCQATESLFAVGQEQ